MGHAVFSSDGDGVMADVNGVRDNNGLSFVVNDSLAAVVLERDTRAESFLATEIPGVDIVSFFVDDEWAEQIDKGGGLVV